MKKTELISELNNTKIIAHRLGYQMTEYPENSMDVLETIFNNQNLLDSCDGFEFDIVFTKDHKPVVLHDKFIDDVTEEHGLVANYTLDELISMNFSFRRIYKNTKKNLTYKIMSLEYLLTFFNNNRKLLKNKEIKIETKDYLFTRKNSFSVRNLKILADIIHKYPKLSKNITHLSYWPLNLITLRKIQLRRGYEVTRSDYLCDLKLPILFSRLMPFLGRISLRIKDNDLRSVDKTNSKLVNKKIKFDRFWMKYSNVISEKNLKYSIDKFGSVGIYTLNRIKDIEEFSKHISYEFFKANLKYMTFTANNPIYLKTLEKKQER